MMAPDKLELIVTGADQRDSHRRRFRKIETSLPVGVEIIVEATIHFPIHSRQSTPIMAGTVQSRFAMNDLHGCVEAPPVKCRP